MSLDILQTLWFILIFVLLAGYAVLDGFDLGVGLWYLLDSEEQHRRLALNAIGPVWDGNEVWLLTGGGALFAAFPPVYAVFGPSFYLPIMLLLTALIFRAVALEFRSKVDHPTWRRIFDWAFSLGSSLAALLLGVALANVVRGLPIDAQAHYAGGFFNLLNPFALLVGLAGLALLAMHGANYMACKTDGPLQQRYRRRARGAWLVFLGLFLLVNLLTALQHPALFSTAAARLPLALPLAALALAGLVGVPLALRGSRDGLALLASACLIVAIFGLLATSMYPNFIVSTLPDGITLNAHDHSSTTLTLTWMTGVAAVCVPAVLAYTIAVYWIFRGKTSLNQHHAY